MRTICLDEGTFNKNIFAIELHQLGIAKLEFGEIRLDPEAI